MYIVSIVYIWNILSIFRDAFANLYIEFVGSPLLQDTRVYRDVGWYCEEVSQRKGLRCCVSLKHNHVDGLFLLDQRW